MSQTRCFFYGFGVGVATALLLAPNSGIRTRQTIAKTVRDGQDSIGREGAAVRDSVVDALKRTRRAAKTTAEGIGDALEKGKNQLAG